MRSQTTEQLLWICGSYSAFGYKCGHLFMKAVDAVLIVYFCYIVILWLSEYNEFQNESECSKPFGLLWIVHFTFVVIFRLFYFLEEYFYYFMILMALERDIDGYRRARYRATALLGCTLFAFVGILSLTFLGFIWFVEEGRCLNKLDDRLDSELKMAFWLFASAVFCILYGVRIVTIQITRGRLRQQIWNEHNGIWWTDQNPQHSGRSLTESEVNAIQQFELSSYDEISWFAKTPLSLSKMCIEMSTVKTNNSRPMEDKITTFQDLDLKQDKDKPSKSACAICQEAFEIGDWYKKLPKCTHCFHAQCIDQWLSTRASCPVCRAEVFITENALEPSCDVIPLRVD